MKQRSIRPPRNERLMSARVWLVVAFAGQAACAGAAELSLRIDNPPTNRSAVALLFNSANTFVSLRDPAQVLALPAGGAQAVRFPDLPAGEYALVVYEDENGNGQLDKNFIGIPRERLGFSNRYWPGGPPSFARAAFRLEEDETKQVDVELKSVFGKRGLLGAGVGVLSQTSPYRDSEHVIVQPIPAITYIGDRVQIFGPSARCGLVTRGEMGLAATASYRLGAYREDDSPVLQGLGDREGTMTAGLALQVDGPAGIDVSAGYEHDLLDRVGGGIGRVGVDKSFQRGLLTLSPQVGMNWITAELAGYEYGVPANRAIAGRPAYRPGDALELEAGLTLFIELSGTWRILLSGSATFLPAELADSPLVDQAQVYNGFLAITRLF
jgi:outer membrane protein